MPQRPVLPSHRAGEFLRKRREKLGLTLRAVEHRAARDGTSIPCSTLARAEQGKLDPGIVRLHRLLRLYRIPPHLIADLLDIEDLAGSERVEGDVETLSRAGLEAWREGNVRRGLACFMAVRERTADDPGGRLARHKAAIAFAVAARTLGKYRLAWQILDEALSEDLEPSLLPAAMIAASAIWVGRGSLEVGLAFARHAQHLVPRDDPRQLAWVLHQRAWLEVRQGAIADAARDLSAAIEAYRLGRDTFGEAKALLLRARLEERRRGEQHALRACRRAMRFAEEHGHAHVALMCRVALGRLLVASGSYGQGVALLEGASSKASELGETNAEFLARYHLWKAHEAGGDPARATFEREASLLLVRQVDEISPEVEEVRSLAGGPGHESRGRKRRRRVLPDS